MKWGIHIEFVVMTPPSFITAVVCSLLWQYTIVHVIRSLFLKQFALVTGLSHLMWFVYIHQRADCNLSPGFA